MSTVTVSATSTARDVASRRARKAFRPLLVLVIVVALIWVLSLLTPVGDDSDFGPNNPRPQGARALAQVLDHNGVSTFYADSLAKALNTAKPGTTVLVYNRSMDFGADQTQALLDSGADIVMLSPTPVMLEATDLGIIHGPSQPTTDPVTANCTLAPAVAAAEIVSLGSGFTLQEQGAQTTLCFPDADSSDPAGQSGHFAQVKRGDQTISVFDDAYAWTNGRILEAGNSALALHLLGGHQTLTWLVPEITPLVLEGSAPMVPPQFLIAAAILLITGLLVIFGAVRRMGPVVSERLPVVVQSSESTRGRGKLYRISRAQGRAAAALRAATAERLAKRLGVPRSGSHVALTTAIANASDNDPLYVEALFYGPAPTSDADLVLLANNLSALESEIAQ